MNTHPTGFWPRRVEDVWSPLLNNPEERPTPESDSVQLSFDFGATSRREQRARS